MTRIFPLLSLRRLGFLLAGLFVATAASADTPKIHPGMSGDEIRARWGAPREIRPMESPEGRAEVWRYRRLVSRRVQPVAVDTQMVPVFVPGAPNGLGETRELVYEVETTWVYQDMYLLMFNDRLVSWKETYSSRRALHK